MKKNKVYIDTFYYTAALSGIKTYIEELVNGIKEHGDSSNEYIFSHDIDELKNKKLFINSKSRLIRWLFQIRYFIWKQIILPTKLFINNSDYVICPDYIAPIICPSKKIVIIHDNLFWKYPANYSKIWIKYFTKFVEIGIKNNSQIVTTSNYSMRGLKKIFPSKKISYIYQSSDKIFPINDKVVEKKYILHIGTFEKRKNLLMLVKAYKLMRDFSKTNLKLVLAGSKTINGDNSIYKKIQKYVLKNDLSQFVIMPGYVNRDEAIQYYNNAFVYVFPSIDEGFGIPLIEAMKMSVPIICSDIEVFKELANDSVLYFNRNSEKDLFNKLKMLMSEKKIINSFIKKGNKRVKKFTRKKFIFDFEKLFFNKDG